MSGLKMLFNAMMVGILIVAVILSFVSFGPLHAVPWILLAIVVAIPYISNKMEKRHYVVWQDQYNVGCSLIDEDHKRLMNLINRLNMAVRYHTGETFEQQAMEELHDYTKVHFAREEVLMRKYNYPEYETHKKQHDAMTAKTDAFLKDYEARGHDALIDVAPYVRQWLINHIYNTDQQYAAFLREKGILESPELQELVANPQCCEPCGSAEPASSPKDTPA